MLSEGPFVYRNTVSINPQACIRRASGFVKKAYSWMWSHWIPSVGNPEVGEVDG